MRGFDLPREQLEAGWEAEEDRLNTIERLREFYNVATIEDLVIMQARHIRKLQEKLPPSRDEQPRTPREG